MVKLRARGVVKYVHPFVSALDFTLNGSCVLIAPRHFCDTFCLLTELGASATADPSVCLGAISYTPDAARMVAKSLFL